MSYASSMPESISGASSPLGRQQTTNQQATNLARSSFYSVLDGSISFGRRTTARLPREPANNENYESEQYDFLALMTAVADLYAQDAILEMQVRGGNNVGKHIGNGAVSDVSSVFAAITRPSIVTSYQVKQRKHIVALKKSAARLFLPNGRHGDADALRGFISEIRVLSHKPLRDHPNIVKILGVNWELESVSNSPGPDCAPANKRLRVSPALIPDQRVAQSHFSSLSEPTQTWQISNQGKISLVSFPLAPHADSKTGIPGTGPSHSQPRRVLHSTSPVASLRSINAASSTAM